MTHLHHRSDIIGGIAIGNWTILSIKSAMKAVKKIDTFFIDEVKDESIDALSNPLQIFWLFSRIALQRNAGLIFLTNKFDLQFSIFENEPTLICPLHLILPRCIRMFLIRLQQNQFKLVKEFSNIFL